MQNTSRILLAASILALAACSDNNDFVVVVPPPPEYSVDPTTVDVSNADRCDITQPDECLFPFPNNYYTVEDSDSDTGLRVNLNAASVPGTAAGDAFDPTELNRNDGFAVAGSLLVTAPGLDLGETGAAVLTDMGTSLEATAPIQLIHAATGTRQLVWAELDAYPAEDEPRALMIRVGKNLQEGERYIAVLQNLKGADGEVLEATDAFKIYQEAIPSDIEALEARRDHFESLFAELEAFGIERGALYLTWDFTVASTRNITERALHIRDVALGNLAGAAPAVTAELRVNVAADPFYARVIEGTVAVANFLDKADGSTGSVFGYESDGPDALPVQNTGGTIDVPYICGIPHAAVADAQDGEVDTRAVILGHGLLGNRYVVEALGSAAESENVMFCGMDWWGMSDQDIITAFNILGNLSLFPQLADRAQQGFLNKIMLSEAIVKQDGFASLPEFQDAGGSPLFKAGEVHFDGISQGGIMGGALSALAPNIRRAVLDIPGMNWSLFMRRSSAWSTYSIAFDPAYPDPLEKPLMLGLAQMLWDRAESSGYANHLTRDPLPGKEATRVLMHVAVGDQTLNETAAELMARTLEVSRHNPTVVDGRHIAVEPYPYIDPITTYPHVGSAMIVWDSGPFPVAGHDGTPLQRTDNQPQRKGYNPHTIDAAPAPSWTQKSHFWRTGEIINACGGQACLRDGYDGTPGEFSAPE